ncbi:YdbH domain-containing protein, partial [Gammaproteobacteria bacterium]|nr:YdbH domain-containing protein [Gammaproteobacteria bacterium]
AFSDVVAVAPIGLGVNTFTSNFTLINDSPLIVEGQADATGIKSDEWRELPGVNLEAEWTWNDGSFEISGMTGWGSPPNANWSVVSHNNEEVRIDFKAALAELFQDLKNYPDVVPTGLEFSDGRIEASFRSIPSTDRNDNELRIKVMGIRGRMGSLEFSDGSLKLDSTDLFTPIFRFESLNPMIKLANGVDVKNLSVSGRWQDGVHLDHAGMFVLGGIINIEPVILDIDSAAHEISLQIIDIELGQILSLVGRDGLSGSGKLSGNIPLLLLDAAVAIDEGRLKNTTKGHISYEIGAETSSRLSNIAIQALQDFQYDLLDATLNYQVNGDYTIHVRLEGRNPELYDGFPVAFNIDLSGSLPELIQASLISRDFHSEILRYVQEKRRGQ